MKILVVDDEKDVVELLKIALEREGFKVVTAYSGEDALKLLSKEQVDLILLDVMMPVMSGWEVVKTIRSGDPKNKDTSIIMVTVKREMGEIERGYRLGVNNYITKPFKREVLIKTVRQLLSTGKKTRRAPKPPPMIGEEVYRAIFHRHPEGILLVGEDELIVSMNAAAEAITGWKAKEVAGQMTCDELFKSHDAEGNVLIASECLRALYNPDEAVTQSEFYINTKDDMEIPISAEVFHLRTGGLSAVMIRNTSKEKLRAGVVTKQI